MIRFWTADLFWEISSTTKLIGWVESSVLKVETCPSNIRLVLENMSSGHFGILGKKIKVCYKYNITDFVWNIFLMEGKIVWYNHQHYPLIKTELNG